MPGLVKNTLMRSLSTYPAARRNKSARFASDDISRKFITEKKRHHGEDSPFRWHQFNGRRQNAVRRDREPFRRAMLQSSWSLRCGESGNSPPAVAACGGTIVIFEKSVICRAMTIPNMRFGFRIIRRPTCRSWSPRRVAITALPKRCGVSTTPQWPTGRQQNGDADSPSNYSPRSLARRR